MLTSLIVCEQQKEPKWFFPLNPSVQSNQEMIEFLIFGEFFENAEGMQGHHFTSSYLFFYTSKWFEKNYTSILRWYILVVKKLEFLEYFWAFQFHHPHFGVCKKYHLIIHLSSIFSTMAFFKNEAILLIFFSLESYISLLSFQQWWSSKLFHTNEELFLLQQLVKKTREMLKYAQSFKGYPLNAWGTKIWCLQNFEVK